MAPQRPRLADSPRTETVCVLVARNYDHDWQRVRLVVLDRDGYRCRLELPGCTTLATHVDHVMTLAEGGARLDLDNLRASCEHCNLRRNAQRQAQLAQAFLADSVAPSPSREW